MRQKLLFLIYFLLTLALTVAADRIFFKWYIFSPENHSGWDNHRWYNFEYHLQKLEKKYPAEDPLVILTGSSIAQYSVSAEDLGSEILKKTGKRVNTELVTHASLMPSDLYQYVKRLRKLQPDYLVFLLNPADFDLERFTPLHEPAPAYETEFHNIYLNKRFPARIFYPAAQVYENYNYTAYSDALRLIVRESLYAFRFRDQWTDALEFSRKAEKGGLRSYLYYQGIPVPQGVWREGRTSWCFSFPASVLKNGKFEAEIPQGLFNSEFYIEFYENNPDCSRNHSPVFTYRPAGPGWQSAEIPGISPSVTVTAVLSHAEPFKGGKTVPVQPDLPFSSVKGVRLNGDFGRDRPVPSGDYLYRRKYLDDERLNIMSDSEYLADYRERQEPPDWRGRPEVRQLNQLRVSKQLLNWHKFRSDIPQIQYLEKIINENKNIKIIIINNPENPHTKDVYRNSEWYLGYLEYMNGLVKQNPGRLYFADLSDALPQQKFMDAHHLTWYGMQEMNPLYADTLIPVLFPDRAEGNSE